MGKQEGDPVDVVRRSYDALSLLYRADWPRTPTSTRHGSLSWW